MKIISWNVNGIRAVERKNEIQKLIQTQNPDILFLQETKANADQLSQYLTENDTYKQYYHSAQKKGYSGVSIWLKQTTWTKHQILTGMPDWDDNEGRIIGISNKKNIIFGVYFPNGGKSKQAWQEKLLFYKNFLQYSNQLRNQGKNVIWCGDFNVAHNEIDLARPKENEKSIGFLPEERSWMDQVLQSNWIDTFRYFNPDQASYTWWSMQTRARERNIGWRIDYFLVDKAIIKKVTKIEHLTSQMGSDHCPICLELNIK